MKYISLIVLIGLMILSWNIASREKVLSVSQHTRLANVIRDYMTTRVLENEPQADGIEFSNLYTEIIEEGRKMKAHFKFSYLQPQENGEPNRVYRKGSFFVTSADGDQWKAQVEEVNDVQVEFIEPQVVGPVTPAVEEPTSAPAEDHPKADAEDHSH